ncbi:MAG: anti-sigma factor family protein, partial [Blastocatellia bacterium]
MYGEHVVERLCVYLDGGLSKQESEEVADHLIGCTFCRLEFEQIKAEAVLAEGHATIGDGRQLASVLRSRPVQS